MLFPRLSKFLFYKLVTPSANKPLEVRAVHRKSPYQNKNLWKGRDALVASSNPGIEIF
jgi:hypothetical protein